jgi:hypothetical protein
MQSMLFLFAAFVGIGLFARSFNRRTRLLLFLVTICVVAYVTFNAIRTP